jgi:hypothetical protein
MNTPQKVTSMSQNATPASTDCWDTMSEGTLGDNDPNFLNVDTALDDDVNMDTVTPPMTPTDRPILTEESPLAPKKLKIHTVSNEDDVSTHKIKIIRDNSKPNSGKSKSSRTKRTVNRVNGTVSGNPVAPIPKALQPTHTRLVSKARKHGPGKNPEAMRALRKSASASGPAGSRYKTPATIDSDDDSDDDDDEPIAINKKHNSASASGPAKSPKTIDSDDDSSDDDEPITVNRKRKAASASGPPDAKKPNTGITAGHNTNMLVFPAHHSDGDDSVVVGFVGPKSGRKETGEDGVSYIGTGIMMYYNKKGNLCLSVVDIMERVVNPNTHTVTTTYAIPKKQKTPVIVKLGESAKYDIWQHSRQEPIGKTDDGKIRYGTTKPKEFEREFKSMLKQHRRFIGAETHLYDLIDNLLWGNITKVDMDRHLVRIAMTVLHDTCRNPEINCMSSVLAFFGFDSNGKWDVMEYGVNFHTTIEKDMPKHGNGKLNLSLPRKVFPSFVEQYVNDANQFGTHCKVYVIRLAQLVCKIVNSSLPLYEWINESGNIVTEAINAYKNRLNNPALAQQNAELDGLEEDIGEVGETIAKLKQDRDALEKQLEKAKDAARAQSTVARDQGERLGELQAQQQQRSEDNNARIADQQATIAHQQAALAQLRRDLAAANARSNHLVDRAEHIDNQLIAENNETERLRVAANTATAERDVVLKSFLRKSTRTVKLSLKAKEARQ